MAKAQKHQALEAMGGADRVAKWLRSTRARLIGCATSAALTADFSHTST
jgi:hypothetical protein